MKKGNYIIISGPSGVGKGTICKKIIEQLDIEYSVSMTTREKREGEIDKVNYYFTTKDDFEKRIKNDEFIEYAIYNNNYYGTLKKEVIDKINKGKNIICEIEVQGAKQVKELFPNSILIFIKAPSTEELKNRLINRKTNDEEDIERRIEIAQKENESVDFYDYVVVNDNLEKAVKEVKEIIEKKIIN